MMAQLATPGNSSHKERLDSTCHAVREFQYKTTRRPPIQSRQEMRRATFGGRLIKPSLGKGVYTFKEAARLTRLRPARVRDWFRGRPSSKYTKPVFFGDYEPVDGDYALSFYDLIDLFIAGHLRERGVSLQTLRLVYRRMQKDLDIKHPFCSKRLLTDGHIVFMKDLDAAGEEELTEVLTRQKAFPEILLPFLQSIDYDELTILARRWRIGTDIVVDPEICFGKPIVEAIGIPTSILAAAYEANRNDAEVVAEWYNARPKHVLAAWEFEHSMAA